jgi:hypothetical protein
MAGLCLLPGAQVEGRVPRCQCWLPVGHLGRGAGPPWGPLSTGRGPGRDGDTWAPEQLASSRLAGDTGL